MTEKQLLTILNKKNIDINDLSAIINAYCSDTNRSHDDFTKIMQIILRIPEFTQSGISNILDYYKRKYNIVAVGNANGEHYFYTSLT
jgi:tRNA G37 N-methylase Trm5